jgi:hypothetical protein
VISLGLDPASAPPPAATDLAAPPPEDVAEDTGHGSEPDLGDGGPLSRLLASAAAEVEALAESGSAAYRGWPRLRDLGQRSESLGLMALGASLRRVGEAAAGDDETRPHNVAQACLRAAYVVRVAAATAAVSAAVAAYTA